MIVLLGDLHFGVKSFSRPFFEIQMDYFENVFFPYLLKNDVSSVFQLGDFSHNRNFIDHSINKEIKDRFCQFFEDNQINFYTLIGNHDIYYKNTTKVNYQSINLNEYEYVRAIDEPTIVRVENYNIGIMPWMCSPEDIKKLPNPENTDILIGHLEIAGTKLNNGYEVKGGLSSNLFDKYKYVYSGHYHDRTQFKNITYIGTPLQLNWGESDSLKGFTTIEKDFKTTFIENNHSPKHLKFYYYEADDGEIKLKMTGLGKMIDVSLNEAKEYAKTNWVKFIIKKYNNYDLLGSYFEKISSEAYDRVDTINETTVVENFDFDNFHKEVQEDVEVIHIIESFMDNATIEKDLDKELLKSIMSNLYEEAMK